MAAGGLGLEPRYLAPKASVLPLDDPPIYLRELARNVCNLAQNQTILNGERVSPRGYAG